MSLPLIDVETLGWSFFGIELERILAEYHLIFSKGLNSSPNQSLHDERAKVLGGVYESLNEQVEKLVDHFLTVLPTTDVSRLRTVEDTAAAIDSIEHCLYWTEKLVQYAWRAQRDVYPYNPKGEASQVDLPHSMAKSVSDVYCRLTSILEDLRAHVATLPETAPDGQQESSDASLLFWSAKLGLKGSSVTFSEDSLKPDITNTTVIHYAAQQGLVSVLEDAVNSELQRYHTAPNWSNLRHDTPLVMASRAGQVEAVEFLLRHADKFDTLESIPSAIFVAAHIKNEVILDILLSQVKLLQGHLPMILQSACFYGHLSILKALIQDDAYRPDLEAKATYGFSPLHLAALNGHVAVIELLLSSGCKPDTLSTSLVTPVDIAGYLGYRESLAALLNPNSDHASTLSDSSTTSSTVCRPPWHKRPRHVTYGHEIIPANATVYVTPGTNDRRRISDLKPLVLDNSAVAKMLDARNLPRSTQLLLMITAENETEEKSKGPWVLDAESAKLPHREWIPAAYFHTSKPYNLIIRVQLVTLMDHLGLSKQKNRYNILAESVFQVPNLLTPRYSKIPNVVMSYCNGSMPIQELLIDKLSGKSVGAVNMELVVAKPYCRSVNYPNGTIKDGSENESMELEVPLWAQPKREWKLDGSTQLYGHRGSGMNQKLTNAGSKLQLGENTALSMVHAVRSGAAFVEFDVQLTRDSVPIIYHDWNVSETGLDVHVNSLTLDQFISLNSKHPSILSRSAHLNDDMHLSYIRRGSTGDPMLGGRKRHVLKSIAAANNSGNADKETSPNGNASPKDSLDIRHVDITIPDTAAKPKAYKGNSPDTIQSAFATLSDLFKTVPDNVGFDIEVKYPMQDEAEESDMWVNFELNWFLDRILDIVFANIKPTPNDTTGLTSMSSSLFNRPIIFTSFHPDVCLLLAHKLGTTFPVLFLTDAGISVMSDRRCNGLAAAVRFSEWARLGGCVSEVTPITEAPRVVSLVQQHGLAFCTYGTKNNDANVVRLQQNLGVDSVIVDSVKAMRRALDESSNDDSTIMADN